MSVHVLSWVFKNSTTEGTERMCLLVLANYADEEGLCWPSMGRIAREMRVSERTAQRAIQALEKGGHIEVGKQDAPDSRMRADRRTNSYRIILRRGDTADTPQAVAHCDGVTPEVERGDISRANGVSQVSPKPSVEPSGTLAGTTPSAPAKRKQRPRDLLFEAIATECGYHLDALTRTERGRLNDATKQLREVDASPEDVTQRASRFRAKYPNAHLTPQALTGHWSALTGTKPERTASSCPDCGHVIPSIWHPKPACGAVRA